MAGGNELAEYEAAGTYNVLHPVVRIIRDDAASPFLVESVAIVKLDPRPGSPDVYNDPRFAKVEDGRFALSALALNRIANAAGVIWDLDRTGVVERERRPDGSVYIRFRATAYIRQPNGEPYVESAHKEIDTADEAEELRAADRRAVASGRKRYTDAQIEDRVTQQILQLRRFLLGHAETKAKSRVIRRLLSLRQVYSADDLAKPFAIPRLLYRPDYRDPDELEAIRIGGSTAAARLFGGSPELSAGDGGGEQPDGEGGDLDDAEQPVDAAGSGSIVDGPGPVTQPPDDDPELIGGRHAGKPVSWVVAEDPMYASDIAAGRIAASERLVTAVRAWVAFVDGRGS